MKIVYAKDALKFLAKMEKKTVMQIRSAISGLTSVPPTGDIRMMQGYSDRRMRLRVGKYRVIFRYDKDSGTTYVYVIDIDSRGGIYK